jgi:hypothetical protein
MAALAKRLIANGVSVRKRMPWQKDWSDERVIRAMLDFPLAVNWAAALQIDGVGRAPERYDPTEVVKAYQATNAAEPRVSEYKAVMCGHVKFGSGTD